MSFIRRHTKIFAVALSCLGLGAAGSAIASAGAASSSSATAGATGSAGAARVAAVDRAAWRRAFLRSHAVHGDLVIYTKHGFKTIAMDRGFVDSVSGNALVMREGTASHTYRTVTLTIPGNARVINQGRNASLSQLTPGEHVVVVQGPVRTLVVARTPAARS